MADDHERQPRQPDNDSFSGALDDLFGPEESQPAPEPRHEQVAPTPVEASRPAPSAPASAPPLPTQSRPYYPVVGTPAPATPQGRSFGRIAVIGCVAMLGLSVACFVALMIIGLMVGEGTSASGPSTDSEPQVSTAVRPAAATVPTYEPLGQLIPMHTYAPVSSKWYVAVTGAIPDATSAVLERNQFNSEPDDGRQFFIATVSVRNVGPDSDVFPAMLLLRAFGVSGYEYSTFDDFCGVIPDAYEREPIAPGETVTGNVCWSVSHDDAATLVMRSVDFPGGFQKQIFVLRE